MDYKKLVEYIVKNIVNEPDNVSVASFDEDEEVHIEVLVSQDDLPRVIGKGGKNINAIRTLLYASSSLNDHKKVVINVDSY